MGKISRFLHFVAFLAILFTAGNVFAAGYSCPTSLSYTECNTGYYLSDCGSTYDGHTVTNPSTNNSCVVCPGTSYSCIGGATCPAYRHTIILSGGTGGTSAIYAEPNVGAYLDEARSSNKLMQQGANLITTPNSGKMITYNYNGGRIGNSLSFGHSIYGYSWGGFNGYYSSANGGTQYINQYGYITTDGINRAKTPPASTYPETWYARYNGFTETLMSEPTRDGYTFDGWYDAAVGGNRIGGAGDDYVLPATGNPADITLYAHWSSIAGYYDNNGTAVQCPSSRPLSYAGATSESDCFAAPFSMKTSAISANTTVNGMYINAAGTFVVDWGDGTVEEYNIANAAATLTGGQLLTHTYTTANSAGYTIKIGGTPAAYPSVGVIHVTSGSRVVELLGSLGALFPTLNGNQNPSFSQSFKDSPVASVPAGLFSGLGARASMFSATFAGCTSLTTVPSGLFSGITGAAETMFSGTFRNSGLTTVPTRLFNGFSHSSGLASNMFQNTFASCPNLTTVADGAFKNLNLTGNSVFISAFAGCSNLTNLGNIFDNVNINGDSAFNGMFQNCTSLTTLPVGLFSGMTTNNGMFTRTFANCTSLRNISGVFDGLTGTPKSGLFADTFTGTGVESVPDGLFAGINGSTAEGMVFDSTFAYCPNLGGVVNRSTFGNITGLGTDASIAGFEWMFDGDTMDNTCPANTYQLTNPDWFGAPPAALCERCPNGTFAHAGSTRPQDCVVPTSLILNKNGIASVVDDLGVNYLDISNTGGSSNETVTCVAGEMVTLPTLEPENPEYMFVGWIPASVQMSQLAAAMANNDDEAIEGMLAQQVECGDASEYVAVFMRQIGLSGWTPNDENTGATGLFGFITIDTPSGAGDIGHIRYGNVNVGYGITPCPMDAGHFCAGVAGRTNAYCLVNSYMSLPTNGVLPAGAHMLWTDQNNNPVTSSILCENAASEYTALAVGCPAGQYLSMGSCTSCPADRPISQPFSASSDDCIGNVMTIGTTQMAAGDEFAFYISPDVRAVFWVDWGDGTVQDIRYDFHDGYARHTYTSPSGANGWTIKIGRQGDVLIYPQGDNAFFVSSGHEFVKSVSGLSNTFPTIVNGPDEPERHQPLFMDAFAGCENLTTIDSNLFANIRGTARESMFSTMFLDTGLTSIPAGLFSGLEGEAHIDAFNGTFINTQITSIPDGMFAGIDEIGAGTFMFTFAGNEHLNPAAYVPRSMFGDIDGLGTEKIDGFFGFMIDSIELKQGCPAGMFRLVAPDDSWDDNNVMFCDVCPAGTTTPNNNTLTECVPMCDELPANATRVAGSCDWECNAGYYGSSANGDTSCAACGKGNFCTGGTNRQTCLSTLPAGQPTPSITTKSNGSWADTEHAVNRDDCVCSWNMYDDPTKTRYFNQRACYLGTGGTAYTHYEWCQVGYYAANPLNNNEWYTQCLPCTNRPAHSIYTNYSTPSVMYAVESNCPWVCTPGYYKNGNSCSACPSSRPFSDYGAESESDCFGGTDTSYPFGIITTNMAANETFSFQFGAEGQFFVDWGDGTVDVYNSTIATGFDSTTNKITSGGATATHTYTTAGEHNIKIASRNITAYSTVGGRPAIVFAGNKYVRELTGSLPALFPTASDSTNPQFYRSFFGCQNLTSLPSTLFRNAKAMKFAFYQTFMGSGLRSLPNNLFEDVDTTTDDMFAGTFQNCTNLNGFVPRSMFGDIPNLGTSAIANFTSMFNGASSMSTTCPAGYYNLVKPASWGNAAFCAPCGTGMTTPDNNTATSCSAMAGYYSTDGVTAIQCPDARPMSFAGATSESQCVEAPFSITTTQMSAGNTFSFEFKATGTIIVDWGDGTINNETSHTYTSPSGANGWTIKFATTGLTNYTNWSYRATISFKDNTYVKSLSGSLGTLLPTLAGNKKPSFYSTFSGCTNLTSVPATLFSGVDGGVSSQFDNTFAECTNLTSVPETLFGDVTIPADYMFEGTFVESGLTSIPSGLFSGLTTYKPVMFYGTFTGTNITETPSNLFRGNFVNSDDANMTFVQTFYGCPNLRTINSGLFNNITIAGDRTFVGTFAGCTQLTSIPDNLFESVNTLGVQGGAFGRTFYNDTNLSGVLKRSMFGNISGLGTTVFSNYEFIGMFEQTNMAKTCPAGYYNLVKPDDSEYWDDVAFCAPCGTGMTTTDNNTLTSCNPIQTTITLKSEGYANALGTVTATYGQPLPNLTDAQLPHRAGYVFKGYFTTPHGGTHYYNEDGSAATSDEYTDTSDVEVWAVYDVCPAGYYCNGSTPTAQVACPENTVSGAGATSENDCHSVGFWFRTVPNTSTYGIIVNATGEFVIDWGDGHIETLWPTIHTGDDPVTGRPSQSLVRHNYASAGQYTVKMWGNPTGYQTGNGNRNATVRFIGQMDQIGGSLGAVFPTLGNGTTDGSQPSFNMTFYGGVLINIVDGVPSTLFDGVTGAWPWQYATVFHGSGVREIPSDLFRGVTGTADSMFISAFLGESHLTGIRDVNTGELLNYIPAGMFGDSTEHDAYASTFVHTGLSPDCPAGMYNHKPIGADSWTAAVCSPCPDAYTDGNAGATSINQCQARCYGGSYVATSGDACEMVGSGYWMPEHYVDYGSVDTRNQCPTGLASGRGAASVDDCGRVVHIGDRLLYTRRAKHTTPSLNVKVDGVTYYADMQQTDDTHFCSMGSDEYSRMRVRDADNQLYWVMGQGGYCKSIYEPGRECVDIVEDDVPLL